MDTMECSETLKSKLIAFEVKCIRYACCIALYKNIIHIRFIILLRISAKR